MLIDVLLMAAGILLLLALGADVLATTVSGGRPGGWFTRRAGRWLWHQVRRRLGRRHGALQLGGVGVVATVLLAWIVTLLLGWWLVLLGIGSVEWAADGEPATAGEVLYMAGYTVSTLGNGELVPGSDPGRAAVVIASTSGILTLTLAITYLVPVLGAVSTKRQLAATLHAIGRTPDEVAARLWPDGDTGANRELVLTMAHQLRHLAQQHHSYPVLHFFHSRHRRTALPLAVASLDRALARTVGPDETPPLHLDLLRTAVDELLKAVAGSFVAPLEDAEDPHLARLRGFVADDGWRWEDVLGSSVD